MRTLELFPELAGLTVFANDEEETPWRAWYAETAELAEQLTAAFEHTDGPWLVEAAYDRGSSRL